MKKILLLPLVALSMLFVNCSDDDDNGSGGSLVGNWQLISILDNGKEVADECDKKDMLTFSSNRVSGTSHSSSSSSTVNTDGSVTTDAVITCEAESFDLVYSVQGDKLLITEEDGDVIEGTFKIEGSKLTLTDTETYEDGGETVTDIYVEVYERK